MFETRKRKRPFDQSYKSKRGHRRKDLNDFDFRGHQSLNLAERTRDSVLLIQAHEADLRRGPQARQLAKSLEVVQDIESDGPPQIGSALIHWAGGSSHSASAFDDQEDTISLGTQHSVKRSKSVQDTSGIWVDRFDARLLLDSLPEIESPSSNPAMQSLPGSPSGWSDLPSDTEETFFFSPEEAEDFRNERRRRLFDLAQEERVKARLDEEEAATQEGINEEPWGDSDEEPDDAQKEFMRRTAAHLLSSPNSAQLEMRILANHGADKRFAFLRGRWSHAWLLTKVNTRKEKEEKERKEKQEREKGLGMLAGYDSDSDKDPDNASEDAGANEARVSGETAKEAVDEMKKELRRQKAKEWAEKRRAQAGEIGTDE